MSSTDGETRKKKERKEGRKEKLQVKRMLGVFKMSAGNGSIRERKERLAEKKSQEGTKRKEYHREAISSTVWQKNVIRQGKKNN